MGGTLPGRTPGSRGAFDSLARLAIRLGGRPVDQARRFRLAGEQAGAERGYHRSFSYIPNGLEHRGGLRIASNQRTFLVGVAMIALLVILGVFLLAPHASAWSRFRWDSLRPGQRNLWDRLFNGGRSGTSSTWCIGRPALAHLQRGGYDAVCRRRVAGRRDLPHWFVRSNTCSATKIGPRSRRTGQWRRRDANPPAHCDRRC